MKFLFHVILFMKFTHTATMSPPATTITYVSGLEQEDGSVIISSMREFAIEGICSGQGSNNGKELFWVFEPPLNPADNWMVSTNELFPYGLGGPTFKVMENSELFTKSLYSITFSCEIAPDLIGLSQTWLVVVNETEYSKIEQSMPNTCSNLSMCWSMCWPLMLACIFIACERK